MPGRGPEGIVEDLLDRWSERRGGRRHLFIGIGGGSASGKTTIAMRIADLLRPLRTEVVNQDRFFWPADRLPTYHSRRHGAPRPDYNRPDSFDCERMFAHCRAVGACADGSPDVFILEGILALYYPELRDLMDVKCYVAADADERIVRRLRRNMSRSPFDEIAGYYLESVRHQHARYNAPTERHADLVIPGGSAEEPERAAILTTLCDAIKRRASAAQRPAE